MEFLLLEKFVITGNGVNQVFENMEDDEKNKIKELLNTFLCNLAGKPAFIQNRENTFIVYLLHQKNVRSEQISNVAKIGLKISPFIRKIYLKSELLELKDIVNQL